MDPLEEQLELYSEQIAAQIAVLSAPPPEPPVAAPAQAEASQDGAAARAYPEALGLPDPIPGINTRVAEAILAEIGTQMAQFPTAAQLCSWARVAPGNRESGGKRYSGQTTAGNRRCARRWCRRPTGRSGRKAVPSERSTTGLASRRGKQKAVIAVARKLLIVTYHVLRTGGRVSRTGSHLSGRAEAREPGAALGPPPGEAGAAGDGRPPSRGVAA